MRGHDFVVKRWNKIPISETVPCFRKCITRIASKRGVRLNFIVTAWGPIVVSPCDFLSTMLRNLCVVVRRVSLKDGNDLLLLENALRETRYFIVFRTTFQIRIESTGRIVSVEERRLGPEELYSQSWQETRSHICSSGLTVQNFKPNFEQLLAFLSGLVDLWRMKYHVKRTPPRA